MMPLIASEVRRLSSRRLVRVLLVALVAVVVVTPFVVDPAFRERARIERDADLERCVAGREPKVRDGRTVATIADSVQPQSTRERECARAIPPRADGFDLADTRDVLRPLGAFLIVAAFVVGASFAGADAQSGALATLLAWEGRRGRLVAARTIAVAGGTVVITGVWCALLIGGLGLTSSGGGGWFADSVWLAARIAVVAGCAAAAGCAFALLGRATAAALGVGLAYVAVFETLVSANFRPARAWLVLGNAIVFVNGRFEGGASGDVPGRSVTESAVILAVYVGLLLLATAVVFQRRDVA
jgi:MFS family permease